MHMGSGIAAGSAPCRSLVTTFETGEIHMADLVDIAIPANAQAAAEALGLKVDRSLTHGAWIRGVLRDEAEIAVECLRDYGVSARIQDGGVR
jgi:hypothetical protein